MCSGDFGLRPRNWVVEAMRLIYGRPFTSSAGKCHAWKWATGETVWHTVVLHAEDVCGVGTCQCLERTGVAYSVFRGLVAVSAKVLCSGGAMDLEWHLLSASPACDGSRQAILCSLRACCSDAVHEDARGSCGGVRCGVPAPGLRRLGVYGHDGGGVGQRHQQQQLDAHARGRGAPCLNCPSMDADSRQDAGDFLRKGTCRLLEFTGTHAAMFCI